jgi:hypothetical protein
MGSSTYARIRREQKDAVCLRLRGAEQASKTLVAKADRSSKTVSICKLADRNRRLSGTCHLWDADEAKFFVGLFQTPKRLQARPAI